jgi:hypothetical protein
MQFLAGIYLFAGLTLFGTLKTPALAFTAFGVRWSVAYTLISILGIIIEVFQEPPAGCCPRAGWTRKW